MQQHGLLPEFSDAVLAETELIPGTARPATAEFRDLRHRLWSSIDNADSRDLDQLSVAEELPDGQTRILVAIAEVDALVEKDSVIDTHARTNTTSVYTPAGIFPMLPEKLSTDLTSLNEGQDRLAIVVDLRDRARRRARGATHAYRRGTAGRSRSTARGGIGRRRRLRC